MATLTPDAGTAALEIGDVPGVKVAGLTIDAGTTRSDVLVRVGTPCARRTVAKGATARRRP